MSVSPSSRSDRQSISLANLPTRFLKNSDQNLTIIKNKGKGEALTNLKILDAEKKLKEYANKIRKIKLSNSSQISANGEEKSKLSFKEKKNEEINKNQSLIFTEKYPSEIDQSYSKKLEDLESRAQKLIYDRMMRVHQQMTNDHRWTLTEGPIHEDFDEELKKFLQELGVFKIDENNKEEDLDIIDKKISIIENIMAEESTLSDALQKIHFTKLLKSKNNHVRHSQNLSKLLSQRPLFPLCQQYRGSKANQLMVPESISHSSFNLASLHQSELYKIEKRKYRRNVQPMIRSTYGREFLQYGSVKKHEKHQTIENEIFPQCGKKQKLSSFYQSDFTEKKVDKINLKELDCFRDKFKQEILEFRNLKISFTEERSKNKQFADYSKSYFKNIHKQSVKQSQNVPPPKLQKISQRTETETMFRGEKGTEAKIKDKSLNKMKYFFKSQLKA